jgi:uncharacterized protein YkwD
MYADEEFVCSCLDYHNTLRAAHGTPALTLDPDLCATAQAWAERLSARAYMAYGDYGAMGESLTFLPATYTGAQAMELWARERDRYDYEQPGWQLGTNYFTQVRRAAYKRLFEDNHGNIGLCR